MSLNYQVQKPGNAWTDEGGVTVPFNRLSKSEKLRETLSGQLVKAALKVNHDLIALKTHITDCMNDVTAALIADEKLPKNSKGNYTWYNFDRSIKIEVNVNETLQFDEAMIAAAREYLDKFITENVQGTAEVVRELINKAFQNTKGGLDAKKVMSLFKYRSKIKAANFQRALGLIEQSISRPSSKKYFRVWAKNEEGGYQNIDLNFSSI